MNLNLELFVALYVNISNIYLIAPQVHLITKTNYTF